MHRIITLIISLTLIGCGLDQRAPSATDGSFVIDQVFDLATTKYDFATPTDMASAAPSDFAGASEPQTITLKKDTFTFTREGNTSNVVIDDDNLNTSGLRILIQDNQGRTVLDVWDRHGDHLGLTHTGRAVVTLPPGTLVHLHVWEWASTIAIEGCKLSWGPACYIPPEGTADLTVN